MKSTRSKQIKEARLRKLSDNCADVAQVALGSVVVPFIFNQFDVIIALIGLTIALGFWVMSYFLAR